MRLGIGFGTLVLLMAFVGLTNLYLINRIDHNPEHTAGNCQVRTEKAYEALVALNEVQAPYRC